MEKIKKQRSYWRYYRPMVIWLEDLTEVVSFLQEKTKEVQISTDDYLFKTIDELKAHVGSQTQYKLAILTTTPHVTVDLDQQHRPRLYVASDPQSTFLFHELEAILSRCQRPFRWAYSLWFTAIVLPILVTTIDYFLIWRPSMLPDSLPLILCLATVFMTIWIIRTYYINLRRACVIRMQRRSDRSSYFERNQDQLRNMLIGAVVGGIATFAGVAAKERFYPSSCPAVTSPKAP